MPDTRIDSLSISVESNSTKAAEGIKTLTSSLSSLKTAVSGSGMGKLGTQLQRISSAVDTISDETISKFSKLATAISGMNNVKISSSVAKGIQNIGKALDTITDTQIERVERLSSALQNIPQTKINISNAGGVGSNTAPNEMQDVPAQSGFQNMDPEPINKAADSIHEATVRTNDFKTAIDNIKGAGTKVRSVFSSIGDSFKKAVTPFANFTEKVKDLGKIATSNPISGLRLLKNEITGVGDSASVSGGKLTQFLNSIGRIAMYRAVRSAIKAVSEGLQDGIQNLYQYAAVVNNPFKTSMDQLATSFLYLKNSVAAAVAPLINAFAPAIDVVVDKVVTLVNAIGKFFAALTGKGFYTQAKKVRTSFAEIADSADDSSKKVAKTTKKAAKEAKEAARSILGFDELNVLNDNKNNKDNSSPEENPVADTAKAIKKNTPDYGSMFEDVPIESSIKDFANQIRDAINRQDWKGLGQLLGNKINSLAAAVDWAGLGDKLGKGLNGAIQTLYWTLKTIDFNALGKDLATLLNHAISQIDWNIAGRLLTRGWTSAFDFLIGFIQEFDWGQLARAISDFIKGAFDEATEWLNSYDWSELGLDLYNNIKDFITNLDVSGMADSIFTFLGTAIRSAVELVKGFFNGLWPDVVEAWSQHVAEYDYGNFAANFFTAISDALGDLKNWSFNHVLTPFMQGLIGEEQWDAVKNHVKQCLDDIEGVLRGALFGVGAVLTFSGANIPLGIALMVTNGFAGIGSVIEDWTKTNGNIHKCLADIEQMVGGAMLAMGAVLTFSTANVPVGIALLAMGAMQVASGAALNWGSLSEQIKQVIGVITTIVSTGALALGALLTFSGINVPLGITLLVTGAASLATSAAVNWNTMNDKIQSVVATIGLVVATGVLALGAILVFTGAGFGIGLGLMLAGAAGLGAVIGENWDIVPNKITETLSKILAVVSPALLALGTILVLTDTNIPLGLGLMVAGCVGLAAEVAMNWDFITEKIQQWFSSIAGILVGAALVGLGLILTLATGGVAAPLGIGMIVAGGASLAASIALNWDTIGAKITEFFSKYGVLAGAGLITVGIILTLATGGVAAPLGIGMIVAGVASTVASVAMNWDSIGQKITEFFGKYGVLVGVAAIAIGTILLFTVAAAPIGIALILAGIGSTVTAVEINAGNITDKVHGGLEAIHGKFTEFHEKVKTTWENIKQTISGKWEEIKKNSSTTWDNIKTTLGGTWDNLRTSAGTTFGNIGKSVKDKWADIKKDTSEKWGNIKSTLVTTWENLKTNVHSSWDSMGSKIKSVWDDTKTRTTNVWESVKSSVKGAAEKAYSSIKSNFDSSSKSVKTNTDSIKNTTSSGFGTSDGGGIRALASNAFKAIATHVSKNMSNAAKVMKTNVDTMKKAFNDANFAGVAGKAFASLASTIQTQISKAVGIVNRGVGQMQQSLSKINTATTHTIDQMQRRINSAISEMNSRVDSAVSSAESRLNSVGGSGGGGLFDFHLDFSNLFSGFANGGFPETGQLFLAREDNIPEMVGTIGGHTAVANNDDIVQAVSDGVESAMLSVLSQTQNSNSNSPVIEVVVKTEDDEVLARAVTRGQEKLNYRMNPVGV